MADTILQKHHASALLKLLSTDDGFRQRYASDPRAALKEAGVPADLVDGLPPHNTAPLKTLAPKTVFASALQHVNADEAECQVCLSVPTVRLSFGK